MEKFIKDLRKGDRFIFNDTLYDVHRKYINDDKPLIAHDQKHEEHRFHFDELVVQIPEH